ncbi:MAG TPA: DUF3014 domain-containing protein [Noviherbaspirillum sp.]
MKKFLPLVLLAVAAAVGFFLWRQIHVAEAPRPSAAAPSAAPAAPAPQVQQVESIKNPLPAPDGGQAGAQPLPSLADSDAYMAKALDAILGSDFVAAHLQLKDFVRRCVATADNLGRSYAPSDIWPVNPTPGRFASMRTERKDGSMQETILTGNDSRYKELIDAVDAVDMHALATLYIDAYPLFQKEYQELGYPNGYFNDRLVEVLDLMIATPEPSAPPEVHLVEVDGPVKSTRPWVRYEFTDPALQSLSAGQKIMLRVGKANRAILRRKLTEFRDLVAAKRK